MEKDNDIKNESNDEINEERKVDDSNKVIDIKEYKNELENDNSEEIIALKKDIEDLHNTVKRTQSDFINYKRRTEEEIKNIAAFANESIILELLTILDNFDRALIQEDAQQNNLFEGVSLIKKQIVTLLEKYGVEEISTDCDFDPNFHFAVLQDDGDEPNKILEVLQKGYKLKEKVIRPTMVKVSK